MLTSSGWASGQPWTKDKARRSPEEQGEEHTGLRGAPCTSTHMPETQSQGQCLPFSVWNVVKVILFSEKQVSHSNVQCPGEARESQSMPSRLPREATLPSCQRQFLFVPLPRGGEPATALLYPSMLWSPGLSPMAAKALGACGPTECHRLTFVTTLYVLGCS